MSEFKLKPYVKTAVQMMRPYVEGEELRMDAVPIQHDRGITMVEGGMVCVNADKPDDVWYLTPEFFKANYRPADPTEVSCSPLDRLHAERAQLQDRLTRLDEFLRGHGVKYISPVQVKLMIVQAGVMAKYLHILNDRIKEF